MDTSHSLHSLEDEGRALVTRLGGRWTGRGGMCRCPAHEDHRPSLSVRAGRASLLLHCFAGCETTDVLRALRAAGQPVREARDAVAMPEERFGAVSSGAQSRGAVLRLWRHARPLAGTPAERYLEGRGVGSGSSELRYHARTPFGRYPLTRYLPALIAAVRDSSGLVAVHRSFLDPRANRLMPMDEPRRGLGRFGSGAVRLGGLGPTMGLAEGIETALSASTLFGFPCWAALGSERFRLVDLPPGVREVVLFLDNDRGGRRAERLKREAFADFRIEARYPRRPGADWNDVLRAAAAPRPAP